jgi:hypothetical protein
MFKLPGNFPECSPGVAKQNLQHEYTCRNDCTDTAEGEERPP